MDQRNERARPKTPPVLRSASHSNISFQSSTIVTKQSIGVGRAQRGRRVNIKRIEGPINKNARAAQRNNDTMEMSLHNASEQGVQRGSRQEKMMSMVQKIVVKIDEEQSESLSGKFKFRSKELGNCFVILNDSKSHLMGVFTNNEYNERFAYNFLEEIEIILISQQE